MTIKGNPRTTAVQEASKTPVGTWPEQDSPASDEPEPVFSLGMYCQEVYTTDYGFFDELVIFFKHMKQKNMTQKMKQKKKKETMKQKKKKKDTY